MLVLPSNLKENKFLTVTAVSYETFFVQKQHSIALDFEALWEPLF